MNLYFLVEGKSSEKKVYPAWLSHLLPQLQQVEKFDLVVRNNYYIFTCNGYPSIINTHLPNAIEDIRLISKYNYLVVCLDAEENTVAEIKQEIYDFIQKKRINLGNTNLILIIQNRCLETWFLGNRKIYSKNPQSSPLLDYTHYYNVSENCPELMGNYPAFNTHAQFHEAYLRYLFHEKNISYSKRNPGDVLKPYYLEELLKRIQSEEQHLPSFRIFIDFCNIIQPQL